MWGRSVKWPILWDHHFYFSRRYFFYWAINSRALFHKYLFHLYKIMFRQISLGTFSAYLTLQALYCIIIIAGIAINCTLEVSKYNVTEGRENSKVVVCSFYLIWVSTCKKSGPYIKIQRKAQSKLYASNFPMWVGKFANSHLCARPSLKDHKSPSQQQQPLSLCCCRNSRWRL